MECNEDTDLFGRIRECGKFTIRYRNDDTTYTEEYRELGDTWLMSLNPVAKSIFGLDHRFETEINIKPETEFVDEIEKRIVERFHRRGEVLFGSPEVRVACNGYDVVEHKADGSVVSIGNIMDLRKQAGMD